MFRKNKLILHIGKSCDRNKSIVFPGLVVGLNWENSCLQFCLDQVVIALLYKRFLPLKVEMKF